MGDAIVSTDTDVDQWQYEMHSNPQKRNLSLPSRNRKGILESTMIGTRDVEKQVSTSSGLILASSCHPSYHTSA